MKKQKISVYTGTSIVIANMIGVGVFTTIGYQLEHITHSYVLLFTWVLGGIFSLAGAFSYAEIGTLYKQSGGEYTYLSKLYSPMIGYLSGWISMSVGFAAPIALAAIGITQYSNIPFDPSLTGVLIIIIASLIHSIDLRTSAVFQNVTTFLKLALLVSFILIGIFSSGLDGNAMSHTSNFFSELFSSNFAIALIFVTFAYSGWNASAYITEEFANPRKDLPKSLIMGTLIVTILFLLVQYVLLKHSTLVDLQGVVEVGSIAARHLFSESSQIIFNNLISLLLISSMSAMIWVGPRITQKMSEEYDFWSYLKNDKNTVPIKAIWFQAILSIAILLTGTFDQILIYSGVLLSISSMLVVAGVIINRIRTDSKGIDHFKSPFFPLFQIIFLGLSIWMIFFAIKEKPYESLLGMMNILLGIVTFYVGKSKFYNN